MEIKKIVVELAGADLTDAVINSIIKSIKDTVIKKCNGKNIGYEVKEENNNTQHSFKPDYEEIEKQLKELKEYPHYPSPEYPYINKGPFVPNPYLPNNPMPLPLQPGDDPNTPQWWSKNTTPIGRG